MSVLFDNVFINNNTVYVTQAIEVVSNCIAKRDFSSLQGLVTDTVLEQVKTIVSNLGDEEVKEMGFKSEDIYFLFPYQVEVVEDPKRKFKSIYGYSVYLVCIL